MVNWKEINKKAVILFGSGKVKKIMDSENFGIQYEVGDELEHYTVTIDPEGRFTCTCKKCIYITQYICSHKVSVILKEQREVFK